MYNIKDSPIISDVSLVGSVVVLDGTTVDDDIAVLDIISILDMPGSRSEDDEDIMGNMEEAISTADGVATKQIKIII